MVVHRIKVTCQKRWQELREGEYLHPLLLRLALRVATKEINMEFSQKIMYGNINSELTVLLHEALLSLNL